MFHSLILFDLNLNLERKSGLLSRLRWLQRSLTLGTPKTSGRNLDLETGRAGLCSEGSEGFRMHSYALFEISQVFEKAMFQQGEASLYPPLLMLAPMSLTMNKTES